MEELDTTYGYYGEKTRVNEGRSDVNAIFFKKERLALLDSRMIPYQDEHYENAFTVCHFKDRMTGCEFVVINTKLTWGDAERRYKEAVQINRYANSFPGDVPVIIFGDFNTFPCLLHKMNLFLDGDDALKALAEGSFDDAKAKSVYGHFGPLCSINNSEKALQPLSGPDFPGFILDR